MRKEFTYIGANSGCQFDTEWEQTTLSLWRWWGFVSFDSSFLSCIKRQASQVQWHMPLIPELGNRGKQMSVSWRLSWFTYWVSSSPKLYSEILSKNKLVGVCGQCSWHRGLITWWVTEKKNRIVCQKEGSLSSSTCLTLRYYAVVLIDSCGGKWGCLWYWWEIYGMLLDTSPIKPWARTYKSIEVNGNSLVELLFRGCQPWVLFP